MHRGSSLPLTRRSLCACHAVLAVAVWALPLTAQRSLVGAVLTDPGELRLAGAEILFTDLHRSARSDSLGRFQMVDVPPGTHSLLVRLNGFYPWVGTLTLPDTQSIEVDFLLKPISTRLAPVGVNALGTLPNVRLAEFEERRQRGVGQFLTADVFDKNQDRRLSDILGGRIPVLTHGIGAHGVLVSTRDGKPDCRVQVVVNGMTVYNGSDGQMEFDVDMLDARDIIGLEYYSVANTPARYNVTAIAAGWAGGAACGTVIIWTK